MHIVEQVWQCLTQCGLSILMSALCVLDWQLPWAPSFWLRVTRYVADQSMLILTGDKHIVKFISCISKRAMIKFLLTAVVNMNKANFATTVNAALHASLSYCEIHLKSALTCCRAKGILCQTQES